MANQYQKKTTFKCIISTFDCKKDCQDNLKKDKGDMTRKKSSCIHS